MLGISLQILTSYINAQAANTYYPILEKELVPAGIDTCKEQCAFLAEIISEGLSRPSENMNYSAKRMTEVWPRLFPTIESAKPYEHNPEKLANKVYGNLYGNTAPGDGWKYRGRGPIGITFKSVYEQCGKAIGVDLVAHPELLEQPLYGIKSAIWFWNMKKLNLEAEAGNIDRISRAINLGNANSKGHAINEDHRREIYNKLLSQWKN